MTFRRLKGYCALIIGFVLPVASFFPAQTAPAEESPGAGKFADIHLNPNGVSPSAECGKCHKDIYSDWKNSLHAQAPYNPVFQTAFLQAYFERGEEVRQICLNCHAPIASLNADFKLKQEITMEGINCDYCHSTAETSSLPGVNGPRNRFEFGLLKQGPLKNAASPVHQTRFNELFSQSQFCGGCHEYETGTGVKLIETYSEWKNGPYPAKGIQCQYCHMRKIAGKTVPEEIKQTPGKEISSHDIAGGHSPAKREESVDIKIASVSKFKQKVEIAVDVVNKGAGHKLPTGIPSKKIVLQVSIQSKSGEARQTQQRTYQKIMVDEKGDPVTGDYDLLLSKAAKILSDNRIAPLETRRENFTFFVPEEKNLKISAAVYYDHNPKIIQPSPIHVKLREVQETLRP